MVSRISILLACAAIGVYTASESRAQIEFNHGTLPNNFPIPNRAGTAATLSTDGLVDLGNEFHSRVR